MDISSELLDNLRDVFKNQRFDTLTGTYDGVNGEITMSFPEGDTEVQSFTYTGVEYVEFKEYLFVSAGECVKRHNANYYALDRTAFIESVTE